MALGDSEAANIVAPIGGAAELRFVRGKHAAQDIIDSFGTSSRIWVATMNIKTSNSELIRKLFAAAKTGVETTLVVKVPRRWPTYFSKSQRERAAEELAEYVRALSPKKHGNSVDVFFNWRNHAKIVATNERIFVGSANYSDKSSDNFEAGVVVPYDGNSGWLAEVFETLTGGVNSCTWENADASRVTRALMTIASDCAEMESIVMRADTGTLPLTGAEELLEEIIAKTRQCIHNARSIGREVPSRAANQLASALEELQNTVPALKILADRDAAVSKQFEAETERNSSLSVDELDHVAQSQVDNKIGDLESALYTLGGTIRTTVSNSERVDWI